MKINKPKTMRVDTVPAGKVFTYKNEVYYKLDGCNPEYNVVRFDVARIHNLANSTEVMVHKQAELRVEG